MAVSRKFNWISSVDSNNAAAIKLLDLRMHAYYSSVETRSLYNQQIADDMGVPSDVVSLAFAEWMLTIHPQNIIEIGCGNGRIWRLLGNQQKGYNYTGVEVDSAIIISNRKKWPEQQWITSGILQLNTEMEGYYDTCFALYVLEHLSQPKKAIEKMWGLIKSGGYLVLIFADFSVSERFPSQQLGWGHEQAASKKLRKGKIIDFLLSLYDSRRRLKPALRNLSSSSGQFLVNTNPVCLHYGKQFVWPDIDAVYLANKNEIEEWAIGIGGVISYPNGISQPFDVHSFMVIKKPV